MKVLIDMNLCRAGRAFLAESGIEARHWSRIGAANAPDSQIMLYAQAHDCLVLTRDLDFGIALATSGATKPSVVQVRADDLRPETVGAQVIRALSQIADELSRGALVTIEPKRTRLRILPFATER
jgi:predicted nuclease of predicted toxin-antitoxin system